ncbi:A24 family peptidase (plasmid) [Aneurinibacillus sp. Ricciae_BoGa-3]|uniref:prepilin peptidase n=1 Tax=Aneurinibacillus sp. Ricciae_BoGa-3 TaxID=3022697 RepID=UPI0023416CE8|nr:A24 family peptidase [Aneurinibacillus sp. Ricciae_BoGa-3]WCK56932.1 A24 family peptidase [Aneurinibacillus sp. Ricciae_BoGa-3]WCK57755.1 A24 family peptidase [Aneurinibacillus sp. Ricciae_BoGa-3]
MFTDSIHTMIKNIHSLYGNYYVVAILTLFLAIASYTDIKALKIPDKVNIVFFVLRLILIPFIGFSISNITGALFGFFILLIPAMIKMHQMGGDIKAMAVIGFYLGFFITPLFVALSCTYGMMYIIIKCLFRKTVGIMPFAPCFLLAHLTIFGIAFFI